MSLGLSSKDKRRLAVVRAPRGQIMRLAGVGDQPWFYSYAFAIA